MKFLKSLFDKNINWSPANILKDSLELIKETKDHNIYKSGVCRNFEKELSENIE